MRLGLHSSSDKTEVKNLIAANFDSISSLPMKGMPDMPSTQTIILNECLTAAYSLLSPFTVSQTSSVGTVSRLLPLRSQLP